MNRVLWRKAVSDAWLQLLASSVLLVLFAWVFVWLMSFFQPGAMLTILKLLPRFVEPMLGVPVDELASMTGRLSVLYVHVITLLVTIGWAVGRGSDAVSGEISRGTMDLLLSLPLRRASVILVSAITTAAGAAILALSVWIGTWIGVALVRLPQPAEPWRLLPGVLNLATMTFCLAGLTTLLSSWDHDRWRTIWLAGGLFAASSILKMVARMGGPESRLDYLSYLSFLTAFEPQQLILLSAEVTRSMAWWYNGTLIGVGLTAYLFAAVIFTCRDIPSPR